MLTFLLLLNMIHTVNVRVMVPMAKGRYHHHPGLAFSRSTFMPKRVYAESALSLKSLLQ
jgi:hypothetical protein